MHVTSVVDVPVQSSAPAEPVANGRDVSRRVTAACLTTVLGAAAAVRLVNIDALGFNSDEAVYAGQAASLGGNDLFTDAFPVFRAHPMLIQSLLSLLYRTGEHDSGGRVVIAMFGVVTVALTFLLGRDLYGPKVGLLAAALLAVMPYHVVVTRQVLLDGPMVFFSTLTLYCLARWALKQQVGWFIAVGAALGLTVLAKESSIVVVAGIYAFIALTPSVRVRLLGLLGALATAGVVIAVHPLSVSLAGHVSTGKAYLVWQLLRRPNHTWSFYLETVPWAIGPLVLIVGGFAVWRSRRLGTPAWREVLLVAWVAAPVAAFTVWPVKGFQYLLPIVPAVVVLAAAGVFRMGTPGFVSRLADRLADRVAAAPRLSLATAGRARWLANAVSGAGVRFVAGALLVLPLLVSSATLVGRTDATQLLAGTGGLPGGRETGKWIGAHTAAGATVLTLGPSMANVVQYYGHRRAYGLSVSPNPLHRNPSYEPIVNPDHKMRNAELQYIVWDAYSAARSPHFSEKLMQLARRYHGRAVHTEYVTGKDRNGRAAQVPVMVVYAVRP